MANETVSRQVNIFISSGEAQKSLDILLAKQKKWNDEIAKTTDPKKLKALNAELAKLSEPIDRAQKKLKGELLPTFKDLQSATTKWLNEFKKTGDPAALENFKKFNAELLKTKDQIKAAQEAQDGLTKKGIFSAAFWANLAANGIERAGAALKEFFSDSIKEALEADRVNRNLRNTLSVLGRSGVFADIADDVKKLRQQFRFLNDTEIFEIFTKLIDLGGLTEKQMRDLLPVIVNFSAKTGLSIQEASEQIINALAGGRVGTELRRFQLNLSDAKTEGERLNVIMTELKNKVEGAGDAFSKSLSGKIEEGRARLKEFKEEAGNFLTGVAVGLLDFFKKAGSVIQGFADGIQNAFGGIVESRIKKFMDQRREELKKLGLDNVDPNTFQQIPDTDINKNKPLGSVPVDDAANKAREDAAKKIKEDQQKLIDDLKKKETDLNKFRQSKRDQEIIEVQAYYARLIELAHGNADLLKQIEETKQRELAQIRRKFDETASDKVDLKKTDSEVAKKLKEQADALQKLFSSDSGINKFLQKNLPDVIRADELKQFEKLGKEKLKLQLKQLDDERALALSHNGLTQQQIANIEEDFRQKRKKAEQDYWAELLTNIINYTQVALDIYKVFADAKTQRENQDLEDDARRNESKKRNLDRRLKSGLITNLMYDRELQKIDKEREKREKEARIKQFRRNQSAELVQAGINLAGAVLTTLKQFGPPIPPNVLGITAMALTTLTGIAQIAAIANRKAPEFASGGILSGRSHASGGNAVVDGSGNKIAEVERGEAIVNKRTMADNRSYNVSGTPGQIISRLNGLYGTQWRSGATLTPEWKVSSPSRMNFSAMKRMFASGGVFDTSTPGNNSDNETITNLHLTIEKLNSILDGGIVAYSLITQQEKQQIRLNAIRSDATLKG